MFSEFASSYNGEVLELVEVMSHWVEQKYRGIGKVDSMPMTGFRNQCLA